MFIEKLLFNVNVGGFNCHDSPCLIIANSLQFSKKYFKPVAGQEGLNIGPYITVPKSRGSVTLQSANPKHHPKIDPNFLSHPEDVEIFVKGQFYFSIFFSSSC